MGQVRPARENLGQQCPTQLKELVLAQGVVGVLAPLLRRDELGVAQDAEVVGHLRLGQFQQGLQVTDAALTLREVLHQGVADFVGKGLELVKHTGDGQGGHGVIVGVESSWLDAWER